MTANQPTLFAGIGGHHSAKARTVEWLTPPKIIAALGPFDLDPCAPAHQPWPTASRVFTRSDNGLMQRWEGRVLLNPPYTSDEIAKWLARMAEHQYGTALIFARTDTQAFHRHVFERATALLFMEGRLDFHFGEPWTDPKTGHRYEIGDIAPGNSGAPTVLCAYGMRDADILATCEIEGQFVPLRFPRSVLVSIFPTDKSGEKIDITWRQVVAEFFTGHDGPVELDKLYRHVRQHPKAAGNRNPEAKARQQLQRGPYRRLQRGLWESAQ